jgi:hypothetical protein
MHIDYSNLIESDVKGLTDLDDVVWVEYPTACDRITKKDILAKLSEIEFRLNNTWTHEFLDEFEGYRNMSVAELAKILSQRLTEIYDWDEDAYYKVLYF